MTICNTSSVAHHVPSADVGKLPEFHISKSSAHFLSIFNTFSPVGRNIDFRVLNLLQDASNLSLDATGAEVDVEPDVEYECESVLRKRKRKMNKHKLQKRRWKERMLRRERSA